MRRYYFDTHVYDYLLKDEAQGGTLAKKVKTLAHSGHLQVFGSAELIGELVPIGSKDVSMYTNTIDLFWELCGLRILRPWNEIVRLEIRKGNKLSLSEAFLTPDKIYKARQCCYDPETHKKWAELVLKRKDGTLKDRADTGTQFEQIAVNQWGKKQVRDNSKSLEIDRNLIIDWGNDILIQPDPTRHGLSLDETTWPDISILPCSSSFVAITLAWLRKRFGYDRKERGSDFYDSYHYALATMSDEFITDDKGLRGAIKFIEWHPNRTNDIESFKQEIITALL